MPSCEASLFDLDHTLLKDNSSYRFGSYLSKQNMFPLSTLLYFVGCYGFHKMGKLSILDLHEKIFASLFKNRPYALFQQHALAFLDENFDSMIYMPALEQLQAAKRMGKMTAILSSSPDFLVKLFAERFGVDEWAGTKYDLDEKFNFKVVTDILDGEAKVKFMQSISQRKGIPLAKFTAYSDSHLDIPFLQAAGHAVGVNPDNKLRAYCQKYEWEII